jgi:hypothetical protein
VNNNIPPCGILKESLPYVLVDLDKRIDRRAEYAAFPRRVDELLLSHFDKVKSIIESNVRYNAFNVSDYSNARRVLKREMKTQYPDSYHLIAEAIVQIFIAREDINTGPHKHKNASSSKEKGSALEDECIQYLRNSGYTCRRTDETGDFGADIIVNSEETRYVIQCKKASKPIGVSAVQEVAGARSYYSADYAVVVADSGFTDAAREMAGRTHVFLMRPGGLKNLDNVAQSLA